MKRQDLIQDVQQLIVSSLDLEDVAPSDINPEEPLFGDGLGLDSIDALELGMALKKKFDLKMSADKQENKAYFQSVNTLVDFIAHAKNWELD